MQCFVPLCLLVRLSLPTLFISSYTCLCIEGTITTNISSHSKKFALSHHDHSYGQLNTFPHPQNYTYIDGFEITNIFEISSFSTYTMCQNFSQCRLDFLLVFYGSEHRINFILLNLENFSKIQTNLNRLSYQVGLKRFKFHQIFRAYTQLIRHLASLSDISSCQLNQVFGG